ncbi:Crp/Fnr family transcriptional regulator [Desulforhopalus sp. IMCC35007]|uniref:Crp/Fnr family transcriptional regulator n=1 Tax=Desulforhopalus sp. IMCC35007 TaxID=2569543 RepID=UPI0010AED517|nr:cyclic nucleotide-binding domain-containing protein [Desulforhopalus sp. IMCC35007]TKB09098.1 cyclic nucleotide-binding domain-containing protein [Desulforhopalus sp. IMCC35007]
MVKYQAELHDFFTLFLTDSDVEPLFAVMESHSLASGGTLFTYGDTAEGMYFVVAGRLAVEKNTGFASRKQVVALLGKGAPVGEAGLLPESFRGTTIVAVEDSTLLYLSKNAFDQLCKERPDFGVTFFRWLLGRVSLRLKSSTERLAHIL